MGDWRLMFLARDGLEQVTADAVRKAASEYLVNDNRTLGLFIPEESPNRADSIVRMKQADIKDMVANYEGRKDIAQGENFDPSHDNIDARSITKILDNGSKITYLKRLAANR
jgi:zinc protease